MSALRVHNLAISLDGFAAGPDQSLENPLGVNAMRLHDWIFETRYGRAMIGEPGGEEGVDNRLLAAGDDNIGATIMGRNMFGPIRGGWSEPWTGWWGDEPPYHHQVFVLTHHAREPLSMAGGTTFNFVTGGIESALEQAVTAADGKDIRLGGGASTVRQYLHAGLLDQLHLAIVPILLGSGERLFDVPPTDLPGYRCSELVSSDAVAHVVLNRL